MASISSQYVQELVGGKADRKIRCLDQLKRLSSEFLARDLPDAQRIEIFESVTQLVKLHACNADVCRKVGLLKHLLEYIANYGVIVGNTSISVLKKILQLILSIASHSLGEADVQAMFSVFRHANLRMNPIDDDKMSLYLSTLELIARNSFGPTAFFDLSGVDSGLLLPTISAFPSHGYTFCAWIRMETINEGRASVCAPLFTFWGDTGTGISCHLKQNSLVLQTFDQKKNDLHEIEVPNLLTPAKWQWVVVAHTHRQLRGSKVDVYLNGVLKQTSKLSYPNVNGMVPLTKCSIGTRPSQSGTSYLEAHLGPIALFNQALSLASIEQMKTFGAFDSRVINASMYESTSNSAFSHEALVFAYDARNCDRLSGLCYDSSSNNYHAEAVGSGLRLRVVSTFKGCVWQLGGPEIFLPLLEPPKTSTGELLQPFPESILSQCLGPKSLAKSVGLIAESLRFSSVNRFCFRRSFGVRLLTLLVQLIHPDHLTVDLISSIELLQAAVASDRVLKDEVLSTLLFNLRIWVNAELHIQDQIFQKMKLYLEEGKLPPSVLSVRSIVRALSWLYWRQEHVGAFRRKRCFSEEDLNFVRSRVIDMIKLLLFQQHGQSQQKGRQLSYESVREFFCYTLNHPLSEEADELEDEQDQLLDLELAEFIHLAIEMLLHPHHGTTFVSYLNKFGGPSKWISLLNCSSREIRYLGCLFLRLYALQSQQEGNFFSEGDILLLFKCLRHHEFSVLCCNEIINLICHVPLSSQEQHQVAQKKAFDVAALYKKSMLNLLKLPSECIKESNAISPLLHYLAEVATFGYRVIVLETFSRLMCGDHASAVQNRHCLGESSSHHNYQRHCSWIQDFLNLGYYPSRDAAMHSVEQLCYLDKLSFSTNGLTSQPVSALLSFIRDPCQSLELRLNSAYMLGQQQSPDMREEAANALISLIKDWKGFGHLEDSAVVGDQLDLKIIALSIFEAHFPFLLQQFMLAECFEFMGRVIAMDFFTTAHSWHVIQDPVWLFERFNIHSQEQVDAPTAATIEGSSKTRLQLVYFFFQSVLTQVQAQLDLSPGDIPINSSTFDNIQYCCNIISSILLDYDSEIQGITHNNQLQMDNEEQLVLIDLLLKVYKHFIPSMDPTVHATYGRTAAATISVQSPSATSGSNPKPLDTPYRSSHPGGSMREIFQLIVRSMWLVVANVQDPGFAQEQFNQQLAKLKYLIQLMKFGDLVGPASVNLQAGDEGAFRKRPTQTLVVSQSNLLKAGFAASGELTSLVLWLIPELAKVLYRIHSAGWSQPTHQLAELTGWFLSQPIQSFDHLKQLLGASDFQRNQEEISRRDQYYADYIESSHSRQRRTKSEQIDTAFEREQKLQHEVIANVTITADSGALQKAPQWMQLHEARAEDSMLKYRQLIATFRRVPGAWYEIPPSERESMLGIDQSVFWKVDDYTSSLKIRGRIVPDVDGTNLHYHLIDKSNDSQDAYETATTHLTKVSVRGEPKGPTALVTSRSSEELSMKKVRTSSSSSSLTEEVTEQDIANLHMETPTLIGGSKQKKTFSNRLKSGLSGGFRRIKATSKMISGQPSADEKTTAIGTSIDTLGKAANHLRRTFTPVDLTAKRSGSQTAMSTPTSTTMSSSSSKPTSHSAPSFRRKSKPSTLFRTKAWLIFPMVSVQGILRVGKKALVFEGSEIEQATDLVTISAAEEFQYLRRRVWGVRIISSIVLRKFLFRSTALEISFIDGTHCFLNFQSIDNLNQIYQHLLQQRPPCLMDANLSSTKCLTPVELLHHHQWTEQWRRRELSNFEYLMFLNSVAGRTYADLSQYPIFPWILKDYESPELDLNNKEVYRDLKRPIGALNAKSAATCQERFRKLKAENDSRAIDLDPYHHSSHYSNTSIVLHYLLRLAPYTSYALRTAGATQEKCKSQLIHRHKIFSSIAEAFQASVEDEHDNKELIPEFFYFSPFLENKNQVTMSGSSKENTLIDSVQLPPWASSPEEFIRLNRLALESEYVSANLNHWIDLIFGYKQRGDAGEDAINIFYYLAYDELVDVDRIEDPDIRREIQQQIADFGQVPTQLFADPHPVRMSEDEALAARYPAAHDKCSLSSRRQVRRQDVPNQHDMAVVSISFVSDLSLAFSICEDHTVQVHTYLSDKPDPRGFPFTINSKDQCWHLPAGSNPSIATLYYEQLITCGHWDGSWRITWASDGEPIQRVAFHKKPISCMSSSKDVTTGDLAVAFGSEDGTISVWALSKFAATRSKKIFGKHELPVGSLPWVLLTGHGCSVSCVALNVDLDLVVSGSSGNIILIHALRNATQLHALRLPLSSASPDDVKLVSAAVTSTGDILVHGVADGVSTLFLISMNGRLLKQHSIAGEVRNASELLPELLVTKSGTCFITASVGRFGGIDVRFVHSLQVHRRIENKPSCHLESIALSPDERCVLAGYQDGSISSYAMHFGVFVPEEQSGSNTDRAALVLKMQSTQVAEQKIHQKRGSKVNVPDYTMSLFTSLHQDLKTTCKSGDEAFEQLLVHLWTAVYPDRRTSFERSGKGWSDMGFQRPDPTTDFRAGGILSLKCLHYFATHFPTEMIPMVRRQIPGSRSNTYPLSPAAINVTCRVVNLLWRQDGEIREDHAYAWPILETREQFYELFCEAFRIFDFMWEEMNAKYTDFSAVIEATEEEIDLLLSSGVQMVTQLQQLSSRRREEYEERRSKTKSTRSSRPKSFAADDSMVVVPPPASIQGPVEALSQENPLDIFEGLNTSDTAAIVMSQSPAANSNNTSSLANSTSTASEATTSFDVFDPIPASSSSSSSSFDPFGPSNLSASPSTSAPTTQLDPFACLIDPAPSTNSSEKPLPRPSKEQPDPFAGLFD